MTAFTCAAGGYFSGTAGGAVRRPKNRSELKLRDEPNFDFPENVALALRFAGSWEWRRKLLFPVCLVTAATPMPLRYTVCPGGGIFVNGMSINDPQSTQLV